MQAKIGELEASLATVTGALQQLSTQQAVHSAPKPPKPPMPEKYEGDRRSGAASNWLHQMTLYVAQGYMAAMDLGLEARYKDVRTS